jgi:hypothetical protein
MKKPALPVRKVTRKGKTARPGWRERQAERVRQAVEFRKAGASFRAIGQSLGISAMQAHRDVVGALKQTLTETAESVNELRQLELARCDELLLFLWPSCRKGSVEAVKAAVKIGERRARLLGLDANVASKLEISAWMATQAVKPEDPLAKLSTEQLQARLSTAMQVLAASANPPNVPKPEPTPLSLTEQYAQVLAARRAEGNGGNP